MNQTLLLNANAQPLSYLPISTISWQEAVKCLYLDMGEVLHSYDGWEVHSPSVTIQVPSIMILKDHVRKVRTWTARENGGPQKGLVFLRDMFVCQYCNERFARRQLTIDHVIPRYYGGRTRWDNITTACHKCNCERGHNIEKQPRIKPFRPSYSLLLKNMRKFPIYVGDAMWNWYLGWPEDLVRVHPPRKTAKGYEPFDIGRRFSLEFDT